MLRSKQSSMITAESLQTYSDFNKENAAKIKINFKVVPTILQNLKLRNFTNKCDKQNLTMMNVLFSMNTHLSFKNGVSSYPLEQFILQDPCQYVLRLCPSSVVCIRECHPWMPFLHAWMTSTDDISPPMDEISSSMDGIFSCQVFGKNHIFNEFVSSCLWGLFHRSYKNYVVFCDSFPRLFLA